MTAKKKPQATRTARKTRRRPVLQFRIAESEYQELAKVAAKHQRTISEEAALRLQHWRLTQPLQGPESLELFLTLDKKTNKIYVTSAQLTTGDREPLSLEALLVKAAKLGAELALKELGKFNEGLEPQSE
ncbi:hypothetical protein [Bradyrhizobium sp. F1.13.3]|uniref:hypothetical protein n=1 Tax=Bradyrhizobium sp. F1.13.3 TaxID=3156351 RepID=UPI0033920FC8